MGLSTDSSGISRELKRLARANKKVEEKALQKAAEMVAAELRSNTPVDPESKGKHLKDNVVIGTAKDGEIQIGYAKEVAWRAHFVEMGTIKQRPQGFIQRTQESMQEEVMRLLEAEIRRGLGL